MKRVLLTGATGFIGRNCLSQLADAGYEVHAVTSCLPLPVQGSVNWHQADLLDPSQADALVAAVAPTHLLHAAWYAVPGQYWTSPANVHWTQASLSLIQSFISCGGRRVAGVGSCMEYDWSYAYCTEARTPTAPATLYGACKRALWQVLEKLAQQHGISAAWGRPFFLYGPHEHPRRLVSSVIRSLLSGETARCTHGNQIRDFLHVEDVAGALVALLDSDVRGAVNIASGQPVALKQIIYSIAAQIGRPDLVQLGALPSMPDEPRLVAADTTRLNGEVGWRPHFDLDAGLAQTIDWWRANLSNEPAGEKP